MGYEGKIAIIPFGKGGLYSDAPQTDILPLKLIKANNCTLINDCAEKDFGSRRWNESALASGIVHFLDWWPSETVQRIIAAVQNGKIYRFTNQFNSSEVTASGSAPSTLNFSNHVSMVEAGNEESGNNKKLFIMTGNDPVQVISGDGTTRTNLASPAADWSGTNQPFFMIPHRGRMFAFGNRNDPHRVYACDAADHENFLTNGATFSVYPGEGQRIVGGFVYMKRLFVLKYPSGLYELDDSDATVSNWFFKKTRATIGTVSPHATVPVFDDVGIGNAYGSITSLKATDQFGDVQAADVFNILKVQNFARNELAKGDTQNRYSMYYPDKQQVYFLFRAAGSARNDRICNISFKNPQQPEVTWNTKDQALCLGIVKDSSGVDRPFYGGYDGYLYQMDQADRWVGTSDTTVRVGYEFDVQTAHYDVRLGEGVAAENNKIFDHLECLYEPCGDWPLYVDIYIDGRFHKTTSFQMRGEAVLGEMRLNEARLDGRVPMSQMNPLKGTGRRISFRAYNSGVGQNVKLLELRVYYRPAGQQQRKAQG